MALGTPNLLASGFSSGTQSVYTSAAGVSLTANRATYIAFFHQKAIVGPAPAISGTATNWTQVASYTWMAVYRVTIWVGVPSGNESVMFTFTFGANQQDGAWVIWDQTGTATASNGLDSVVQYDSATGSSSGLVTLATFRSTSAPIGVTAGGANPTVGSGFTSLVEVTSGLPNYLAVEYRTTVDETVDWSGLSSTASYSVAMEIGVPFVAIPRTYVASIW